VCSYEREEGRHVVGGQLSGELPGPREPRAPKAGLWLLEPLELEAVWPLEAEGELVPLLVGNEVVVDELVGVAVEVEGVWTGSLEL
jgi:hypothetical protein